MSNENIQEENNDNIKTKSKIVKAFGICLVCNQEVGLEVEGEYVGCTHHLYTINRELIKLTPKVEQKSKDRVLK